MIAVADHARGSLSLVAAERAVARDTPRVRIVRAMASIGVVRETPRVRIVRDTPCIDALRGLT